MIITCISYFYYYYWLCWSSLFRCCLSSRKMYSYGLMKSLLLHRRKCYWLRSCVCVCGLMNSDGRCCHGVCRWLGWPTSNALGCKIDLVRSCCCIWAQNHRCFRSHICSSLPLRDRKVMWIVALGWRYRSMYSALLDFFCLPSKSF
jgi:hypothetical protein